MRGLIKMHPERFKSVEKLDDSTEFKLVKDIFFKVDWQIGMGGVTGKDFFQIVWYCENLGIKNYKKYIPILHTMGKIWAQEAETWHKKP